jgi:hypothetical protein
MVDAGVGDVSRDLGGRIGRSPMTPHEFYDSGKALYDCKAIGLDELFQISWATDVWGNSSRAEPDEKRVDYAAAIQRHYDAGLAYHSAGIHQALRNILDLM